MNKIEFILIDEKQGWEPNIDDAQLPASVTAVHVRSSSYGGWDIIADLPSTNPPGASNIQVDGGISKREDAEKIALLWIAGRLMREPAEAFYEAAQKHNYRHPQCPQAHAALLAAERLRNCAADVRFSFTPWDHERLCKSLPTAVDAAHAAAATFATKPKSNCAETQATDQETAKALISAADALDLAKGHARDFQLSAGFDPAKKAELNRDAAHDR